MFRGKDTVGDYLCHNFGFIRLAFADQLKEYVGSLYNLTHEQMYTDLKNELDPRYNLTPREILQDFGQEQRSRFPEIWPDIVSRKIKDEKIENVVITDFRFQNEYECIRRHFPNGVNIICVRIDRPELDDVKMPGKDNISETSLDNFQYWSLIINNNESIEELYNRINFSLIPMLRR